MTQTRSGGLAAWSARHPIGITLLALVVLVLGAVAGTHLRVDLLPHLVYPEIAVRVLEPGVPAPVMEERVTRQIEEQLAITEHAIGIQSTTSEGRSAVELLFPYGTDLDRALRDASIRLDRARRFLPTTIQPPIIYKRDPSQIPVFELVIASRGRDAVALRDWVDHVFSKWLITLPGVAAVEVGGGLAREIQVLPDPVRLAQAGLTLDTLAERLRRAGRDLPGGRVHAGHREFAVRTLGRFRSLAPLRRLPIRLTDGHDLPLAALAEIRDTHAEERLRVRYDGRPGVKVSIQKQPEANTVAVVDALRARIAWLRRQHMIPPDLRLHVASDQSVFIRHAVRNARWAAISGGLLAMAVVWLFLGDLRRTLVIGTAIPLAVAATVLLMAAAGITLNLMTLGGLAVGVGMLVDSAIVMLEALARHREAGLPRDEAAARAAAEVFAPIVAATTTNLAALLPFLFVTGLVGLLFRELLLTLAAALVSALLVAVTLVPAWGARLPAGRDGGRRFRRIQAGYRRLLDRLLAPRPARVTVLAFLAALGAALQAFSHTPRTFLPRLDTGAAWILLTGDPGTDLETMDATVRRLEALLRQDPAVAAFYTITGGFIFGRSEYELSNHASLLVHLQPPGARRISLGAWIRDLRRRLARLDLVGYRVRIHPRGVPGLRTRRGGDDIALRIQGPELPVLQGLGERLAARLQGLPGLANVQFSGEETRQLVSLRPDRLRLARLGLDVDTLGRAVRHALEGVVVGGYRRGDREYDLRLLLPPEWRRLDRLAQLPVAALAGTGGVPLGEVATPVLDVAPAAIERDQQQRIVEVSASLDGTRTLESVLHDLHARLADFPLPPGYRLYDAGLVQRLQQGTRTAERMLALALFLVFAAMAVQYESLRAPFVILLAVPFSLVGALVALDAFGLPLSMPAWLGAIMLAGIVVNNAIVLVDATLQRQRRGMAPHAALVEAAGIRLRPILMTTLTTLLGLLPLALGLGEGAELLQPLAVVMVGGLGASLATSLLLIPILYRYLPGAHRAAGS
ncbi:MAG: efflux RND transporter permease subunit [Gammaproteobacteria bacterium]|nr:MAG: efflux RND transporter permease subunit [Gammaproteobacteria bacterium]